MGLSQEPFWGQEELSSGGRNKGNGDIINGNKVFRWGNCLNGETGYTLENMMSSALYLLNSRDLGALKYRRLGSRWHYGNCEESGYGWNYTRNACTVRRKGAKGREHQHPRDGKRKQSSLKRELRMQPEKSRKTRRACPWTSKEGDI